jgi:hypothetical protein
MPLMLSSLPSLCITIRIAYIPGNLDCHWHNKIPHLGALKIPHLKRFKKDFNSSVNRIIYGAPHDRIRHAYNNINLMEAR